MRLVRRREQGSDSPFDQLNRIQNEISRILEHPLGLLAPATSLFEGVGPNIDIFEDKDKITVKAELPGMKKEDIDVSLEGNTLTISGERKHEEEHKDKETYRSELFFGRFQRSVTLTSEVDPGKVQANYQSGVLTITLPKAEEAKPKAIEVKAAPEIGISGPAKPFRPQGQNKQKGES